jgi:CRP-like cAMP-binding protein
VLTFLLLLARDPDTPDDAVSAALDLPMPRSDIGDYLGLTIETVSCTFTALKEEGLIDLPSAHHVMLPDLETVEAAANAD